MGVAATESPSAARRAFEAELDRVRSEIVPTLANISQRLLEARLLITREFRFEPPPEELQAMVRLAGDPELARLGEGLPLRLLAVRILVEQTQREFWDTPRFGAARLRQIAESLPWLIEGVYETEDRLETTLNREGLNLTEKDILRRMGRVLLPSTDDLIAAEVLAPLHAALAEAGPEGDILGAVPHVTEAEAAFCRTALTAGDSPGRVSLDGVLLRALIRGQIVAWAGISTDAEAKSFEESRREALKDGFPAIDTTYRLVGERLQVQLDAALGANLGQFAEDMRRIRSEMFTDFRLLTATTRRDGRNDAETYSAEETRRLLEQAAEADAAVEGRVSDEDVMLDALTRMKDEQPEPVEEHFEEKDRRRERRRLKMLIAVAAVLAVITGAVWMAIPARPQAPIDVAPYEFRGETRLSEATSFGPVMYAKVANWHSIPAPDRLARVQELGLQASEKGFEGIAVVDADGRSVAVWSRESGARLAE